MQFSKIFRHTFGLAYVACGLECRGLAAEPVDAWPEWQLKGLLEGRIALTDPTPSWQDRGFGKTRYGGSASGEQRGVLTGEASVVAQAHISWNLTAVASLTANEQQRHAVDAVEAYLLYKSDPSSAHRFRFKLGAFFPPVSLENTGLAWTSPYTINFSAINTWIGEELRTIGAEATFAKANDAGEWSVSAAAFGFNDPVGSLLAWRGWAVHDREAGLRDRLPLAALPSFAPGGSAAGQANAVTPFTEIDDRVGYYLGAAWAGADGIRVRTLWYDNQANSRAFDGRQYGWRTRFGSVAASSTIFEATDIVVQTMIGNIKMAAFPTFTVVDNDFSSVSVLLSRQWQQHRVSARVEYFDVTDRDFTRDDPNGEHGSAATLSYVYRPDDNQRLTFELLNVRSTRQSRAGFGLSPRANETTLQASYRFFFSTK